MTLLYRRSCAIRSHPWEPLWPAGLQSSTCPVESLYCCLSCDQTLLPRPVLPSGVQVRCAATLGGHFGLLASKPLPTDLGLVLAAAGARLQVLTVRLAGPEASKVAAIAVSAPPAGEETASHAGIDTYKQRDQQKQGQKQGKKQGQQLDLKWVSVEEYIASSCVGNASGSSNGGGVPASPAAAAAGEAGAAYQIITAVLLPYADDSCQKFCSYKLGLRHFNSHALVNAALLLHFDPSTVTHQQQQQQQGSDRDSNSRAKGSAGTGRDLLTQLIHQADLRFAGAVIASARVFAGFPSDSQSDTGGGMAASAGAAGVAGGAGQQQEGWCVVRLHNVEQELVGKAVEVQVRLGSRVTAE